MWKPPASLHSYTRQRGVRAFGPLVACMRTQKQGDDRYYVNDDTGERYPGVTSIIGTRAKPFLQRWAARLSAELAVDALPYLQQLAERDRAGAIAFLANAAQRYTKQRGEIGSEAHIIFERMIRGQSVDHVPAGMEPYRANFAEFLAAVNPELVRAEDIVVSDTYGYAGSFDVWLNVWLDGNGIPTPDRSGVAKLVLADWKTGKKTYPEVGLQLGAYANADYVMAPDGTRDALPVFDGFYVLHITAEGWEFVPITVTERDFDVFVSLLHIFNWNSRHVIGKPVVGSGEVQTGTERRA